MPKQIIVTVTLQKDEETIWMLSRIGERTSMVNLAAVDSCLYLWAIEQFELIGSKREHKPVDLDIAPTLHDYNCSCSICNYINGLYKNSSNVASICIRPASKKEEE